MVKKIAVFIPVYNGEKYLEQTLKSVLEQTFLDFNIFCVDDSSTDSSLKILEKFAENDSRFKIFQKPNGGSTAKCWNFILPYILEDYIFYMSQDDLLSSDFFEKLILRAEETFADCILPDMEYFESNRNGDRTAGVNGDRSIILSGVDAFILSLTWKTHGFALRKKQLYEAECFPEVAFDSDEYMSKKLFLKSKSIAFTDSVFFYRQDNENAVTKKFTIKNYFTLSTQLLLYDLFKTNHELKKLKKDKLYSVVNQYLQFCKFFNKNRSINTDVEKNEIYVYLKTIKRKLLYEVLISRTYRMKYFLTRQLLSFKFDTNGR